MEDMACFIGYAPEAWLLPLLALCVACALKSRRGAAAALAVLALMVTFYRGRLRHPPEVPGDVLVSPCDGRVLAVEEHPHAVQVAVFLQVHNVHVQYTPVPGRVASVTHKHGQFHPAYMFKKSSLNERVETVIDSPTAGSVTVVQIAGLVARRILSFHAPGTTVLRGQPLGLIKFGSRVDVWVPREAVRAVAVRPGQRVRIGDPMVSLNTPTGNA